MIGVLEQQAHLISGLARARGARLVLAESCTAGLVAHFLSRIPGASDWWCGSAVVYRNATKTAWLHIDADSLADPVIGPVSAPTTVAMTTGVLAVTPEATLAAGVTGHLGPQSPPGLDGVLYVATEFRYGEALRRATVERYQLSSQLPPDSPFTTLRLHRQHEAALMVLRRLHAVLAAAPSPQ